MSAEAERRATEGKSAKMKESFKKSYLIYLFTDYPDEGFEAEATGYESIFYDEGCEYTTAAFNDRLEYRGYASRGTPGRGFGGRGRGTRALVLLRAVNPGAKNAGN